EAIRRCEGIVHGGLVDRQAEAVARSSLAVLLALGGDFAAARDHYGRARDMLLDIGGLLASHTSLTGGRVELRAGDPAAAEIVLRRDYDALGTLGERYFRPLVGSLLARALFELGRLDEAVEVVAEVRAEAADDDVEAQALWRLVQARVAAERGAHDEAERLAAESIARLDETDALVVRADARLDAAVILAAAADLDGARTRLR